MRSLSRPCRPLEAELYGLSMAVCDLLTVTNLLEEVGYALLGPVPVYCDSRGHNVVFTMPKTG